jgi:hypothetical protein
VTLPRPLARGPPLVCSVCGSRRVLAVRPGSDPVFAPGGIVIAAGLPRMCWCRAHWPQLAAVPKMPVSAR